MPGTQHLVNPGHLLVFDFPAFFGNVARNLPLDKAVHITCRQYPDGLSGTDQVGIFDNHVTQINGCAARNDLLGQCTVFFLCLVLGVQHQ